MLQHLPSITAQLAAALGPTWAVVDGSEPQDRRGLPRADLRLAGASLGGTSGPGVTLQARYMLRLVVDAGAGAPAFAQLDAAVDAAIAALHHWRPPGASARLALQGMAEAEYIESGLWGYDLGFALTVMKKGFEQ